MAIAWIKVSDKLPEKKQENELLWVLTSHKGIKHDPCSIQINVGYLEFGHDGSIRVNNADGVGSGCLSWYMKGDPFRDNDPVIAWALFNPNEVSCLEEL